MKNIYINLSIGGNASSLQMNYILHVIIDLLTMLSDSPDNAFAVIAYKYDGKRRKLSGQYGEQLDEILSHL